MAITNTGKAEAARLIGNTGSPTAFTYLAVGTTTTAAAATDTALLAETTTAGLARAAATVSNVTTTVTNDTLQLAKTWSVSGSVTIGEVGILNAAASGILLARYILSPTRSVASGDGFTLTYKIKVA